MQGRRGVLSWLSRRKALASTAAIAVLAGVPVTIALTHKGFPVSDVSLHELDVWVTDGADAMAGRLNHQIDQLDAAVNAPTKNLDVLQDSAAYFLVDAGDGTVQKIDPAFVSTSDQITVPKNSWVGYGGNTLAILSPDGRLWTLDATNRIVFDATKDAPVAKLGTGAVATVAKDGETFAASSKKSQLVSVPAGGTQAEVTAHYPVTSDAQITAVGSTPVVLDKGGARLRAAGKALGLPSAGLQLQQPSPASSDVLVSAASALYRVPLAGSSATTLSAGGTTPAATTASQVSAPVQLGGCDYAAWASNARYLYACAGGTPVGVDIGQPVTSDDLRFRVNHGVIALNDLQNGDAWVASTHLTLVKNWEQLKPATTTQKKSNKGQKQPVMQSYQNTLAHRTTVNHQPKPQNDDFGVRAGRTTLLPVLDNDEDPDGDVLTVKSFTSIPKSLGTIDMVDGGRALQFEPAPGATGGTTFHYTVTDGRGGEATADTKITIHPQSENGAPKPTRLSTAEVEQNQSITYNVLQDWIDPDGDAIYLQSATPTTADGVSFTPDGEITFTNKTGQIGAKTVDFVVSDGKLHTDGQLQITVKPRGSLDPIAVPDFAQVQLGRATTISPLANDVSPSGAPLSLVKATSTDSSLHLDVDEQQGTISVTGTMSGPYYFTYQVAAGDRPPVEGLVRVDVIQAVDANAPPIAVNDVVYVHPGQTASVDPLDNDVSPSGRVLAVQSVEGGADAAALNIQLLDNTEVKVTSPGVLTSQVQLTYMVSDGVRSAPGTITVVPVAPLVNYQPPVAVTDYVNIRAGDIATVHVLDNDYSPDDQPFSLNQGLSITKDSGGATAFVSGSDVRIQAPSKAGVYSVGYTISDDHQQTAHASVVFTVLPESSQNQAPVPQTLTARVFAGSAIPIDIPLDGIDPDGDSVFFEGVTSKPELGSITGQSATGFVYQAAASSGGTDELSYTVVDTHGATATGTIRIGVIPRPTTLQQPTAVNDKVEVKPGKTGAVDVLANDSDPNGYPLTLESKLGAIDKGLTDVSVDGSAVLFTAPMTEGAYLIAYTVSNGHGGTATAYVQVIVSKTAKPRYPTATDHYVDQSKAKGKSSVSLDALTGATNPSGPVSALEVSVTGPNAGLAKVDGANVTVATQNKRTIITYVVTDPATKLVGKAFIIVPPSNVVNKPTTAAGAQRAADKKTTPPPHLKPGLPEQVVDMNSTKTFSLSELVDVPSGRPASLVGPLSADHGTVTRSGDSFTFTPAKDYRGPAQVSFGVDDGKEQGTTADRITPLNLPITVGAKDQSDVPPTFTPPHVQIEPGEAAKSVDLRSASYHPNPQILSQLKYTGLTPTSSNGVTATLSGSTLALQAAVDTQPGTTAEFDFKVVPPKGAAIDGKVYVTVVSSTRPLAEQKNPPQTMDAKRGTSVTLSDAVGTSYWVNPFPDTPLTITDATLANAPAGVTVQNTTDSITVAVASGAAIGTVSVNYHVQDATKDPQRTAQVIGQFQVTIHDRPDAPAAPTNVSAGDGTATMTIAQPANNGKPITGFEVRGTGGSPDTTVAPGSQNVTFNNLKNGTSYAFQVRAENADGWSDWSAASATVTPYGTVAAPSNPRLSADGQYAPSTFTMSWTGVSGSGTGGMSITYEWSFDGATGTIAGTSRTTASKPQGTYNFSVRTIGTKNNGQQVTSAWVQSGSVSISDPPPPPPAIALSKGARTGYIPVTCTTGNCYYYNVQATNFKSGSYTLTLYCENSNMYSTRVTVPSSGSFSYNSKNGYGTYCGFPNTWVTLSGGPSGSVSSPTENFSG